MTGELLGWRHAGWVEQDAWRGKVLALRFPGQGPGWKDIRTFDSTPFRGVDRVVGGFPCKGLSHIRAGARPGFASESESSLWWEFHRVVATVQPGEVLVENVEGLSKYPADLAVVLSGLADLGYRVDWLRNYASDVGAPQPRSRIWILGRRASAPRWAQDPVSRGKAPGPYLWATPTENDARNAAGFGQWRRHSHQLNVQATHAEGRGPGEGQLNPDWVARLMGWPVGYLNLTKTWAMRDNPAALAELADPPPWVARWRGTGLHAGRADLQLPGEPPRLDRTYPARTRAIAALGVAWCPQQAAAAYLALRAA